MFENAPPLIFKLFQARYGSAQFVPTAKTLELLRLSDDCPSALKVSWEAFLASAKQERRDGLPDFIFNSPKAQAVIVTDYDPRMIDKKTFPKAKGTVLIISTWMCNYWACSSGGLIRHAFGDYSRTLTVKKRWSLRASTLERDGDITIVLTDLSKTYPLERKIGLKSDDIRASIRILDEALKTCLGFTKQQMEDIADEEIEIESLPEIDPDRCSDSIVAAFKELCFLSVPAERIVPSPKRSRSKKE